MKKKIETKHADKIISYQKLFDSPEGLAVLYDLMKATGYLTTTFAGDPYESAYNEGQRSIVCRILQTINTDPAKILELIKQGNQEEGNYA